MGTADLLSKVRTFRLIKAVQLLVAIAISIICFYKLYFFRIDATYKVLAIVSAVFALEHVISLIKPPVTNQRLIMACLTANALLAIPLLIGLFRQSLITRELGKVCKMNESTLGQMSNKNMRSLLVGLDLEDVYAFVCPTHTILFGLSKSRLI